MIPFLWLYGGPAYPYLLVGVLVVIAFGLLLGAK